MHLVRNTNKYFMFRKDFNFFLITEVISLYRVGEWLIDNIVYDILKKVIFFFLCHYYECSISELWSVENNPK